jgi:NACHT domain/HEAT repeats
MSLVGIGSAIAPWLGEWATVAVAGSIMKGVRGQFDSNEMERVLKRATAAAEAAQPETGGLFFRCDRDGRNGVKKFLEQFFQSGEVLKELQKPLQDSGKPDVNILVAAFERLAKEHPEAKNYLAASLLLWMQAFVESYFEQVKGICFQVAKAQYLKQLAQGVDDVKFVGIAVPGEEVEKQEVLAQIFVMPDVRKEHSPNLQQSNQLGELDLIDWESFDTKTYKLTYAQKIKLGELRRSIKQDTLLKEQTEWAMRDRLTPRIPAPEILGVSQKRAVVLGAPGSGKTMLVRYFALMLCGTAQSDPAQIGFEVGDDWLPVVVRIRAWILSPEMGLLEYLRSNAKVRMCIKKLPQGFFEHWLDRGRALILFDGLDEVVEEAQRRKVAEQIKVFLHQYKDNPVVITSRPAGYRWDFFNLDEFPHYILESFDDKQVATFIDHWYDSRIKDDRAQVERRKADLQKAFDRNERIKLLAKNPLLLTIITLIHRYQAELPLQRYKLYEKAVETLLTGWDSGKEIKLYEQVLRFLKPDDLLYVLKKLAYWIHAQGSMGETEGGTLIDKDELLYQLGTEIKTLKKCEFHESKEEAKRFIEFIQKRTGLLNEQGRDRYAFVHKTFQEYLTSEEIYDRADYEDDTSIISDHFREHLHEQHWREVLLLLVSKLKGKKAQKAIQAVLDVKSEHEKWLHRDLFFAGWCLTEDPPKLKSVGASLIEQILDELVDLAVNTSNRKICNEAKNILLCFGKTTMERDVWVKLEAEKDRIDLFQFILYQTTLGQEEEALTCLLLLLGNLEKGSKKAESDLLSLAMSQYSRSRSAILLGNLGKGSKEAERVLLSLLVGKQHSTVRSGAAEALGKLGVCSKEVESGLLSLLGDEYVNVRSSAAEELGKLGKCSKEVESVLSSLLGDKDSDMRFRAAEALGKLGVCSKEVESVLLSLLGDKDSDMRSGAAETLGKLAKTSPTICPAVVQWLEQKPHDGKIGDVIDCLWLIVVE